MNESVESVIKKIKLREEDNDAKLKEKREFESAIANLKRTIRDSTLAKDKSVSDQRELINSTTKLRLRLQMEQIRQQTLNLQISSLKQESYELRHKCDQEIYNVWNTRSSFCNDVHEESDQYDIRALLLRPPSMNTFTKSLKSNENARVILTNSKILCSAKERLQKAISERDRLQIEPDIGEEFVRIKNALQYSLKSISSLKQNNKTN